LSDTLMVSFSPYMGVIFAFYIAFAVLAVMNVVTGVFVESAVLNAKKDADTFMINNVRDLFETVIGTTEMGHKGMTWDDFEAHKNSIQMTDYFKSLDVDPSDARGIFCLLDSNDTGAVTFDAFVSGCVKLRGGATSLDLAILQYELRRTSDRLEGHVQFMEGGKQFGPLLKVLPSLMGATPSSASKPAADYAVVEDTVEELMHRAAASGDAHAMTVQGSTVSDNTFGAVSTFRGGHMPGGGSLRSSEGSAQNQNVVSAEIRLPGELY